MGLHQEEAAGDSSGKTSCKGQKSMSTEQNSPKGVCCLTVAQMGAVAETEACPVLAVPVYMDTKDAVRRRSWVYQECLYCSGSKSQGHQESWKWLMILSVWQGTHGFCESLSVFTVVVANRVLSASLGIQDCWRETGSPCEGGAEVFLSGGWPTWLRRVLSKEWWQKVDTMSR